MLSSFRSVALSPEWSNTWKYLLSLRRRKMFARGEFWKHVCLHILQKLTEERTLNIYLKFISQILES